MNDSFPRIITLLRTERNITQKDAARDLNISQALLSHYERGARECGLDFLIKIADYYGVSCDYLLGRTSDRSGAKLTVNDIPEPEESDDNILKGSTLPILNKKLIANSLNIIFDLLQSFRGTYVNAKSHIRSLASGKETDGMKPLSDTAPLAMSFDSLNADYQLFASSLMNLIRSAENAMDFSKNKQ